MEKKTLTEREWDSEDVRGFIGAAMQGMNIPVLEAIQVANRLQATMTMELDADKDGEKAQPSVQHFLAGTMVLLHYYMDTIPQLRVPMSHTLKMFTEHLPTVKDGVIERIIIPGPGGMTKQ